MERKFYFFVEDARDIAEMIFVLYQLIQGNQEEEVSVEITLAEKVPKRAKVA